MVVPSPVVPSPARVPTFQREVGLYGGCCLSEADVLFKAGCALLLLWLPGVFGLYGTGRAFHLLLLLGLLCLMLGLLKAREANIHTSGDPSRESKQ